MAQQSLLALQPEHQAKIAVRLQVEEPTPNPSVEPTNCGKPQSAAHLER